MKTLWTWIAYFLLLPILVFADSDDKPITTAAEMSRWCKDTSYSHLSQQADRLYNWTHSVLAKGNTYVVRGHWRVNDDDVYVECKSRIGAERGYATYRVLGKEEN